MDVRAEGRAIAFAAFTDWEGYQKEFICIGKTGTIGVHRSIVYSNSLLRW